MWFLWYQTLYPIIRVILQQFIFTLWNVLIVHGIFMIRNLELTSQESVGVPALTFRTRLPKWNSDISNMSRHVPHSDGICGIGWKWTATVNRLETESYLKVIIIAGVNKIFLKVRKSIEDSSNNHVKNKMKLAMLDRFGSITNLFILAIRWPSSTETGSGDSKVHKPVQSLG